MGRCYYRPSGCQPIALEMTSLDLNPQRCHSAPPSSISPLQGGLLLGSRASPWRSVPRSDWLFVFFLKMLSQTLKRKVPFYSLLSWHHQILLWLLVFAQYPCAQCFKHYVTQESRHDSLRVVVDPCLSVWPGVLRLQLTGHCPNHSAQLFAFSHPLCAQLLPLCWVRLRNVSCHCHSLPGWPQLHPLSSVPVSSSIK